MGQAISIVSGIFDPASFGLGAAAGAIDSNNGILNSAAFSSLNAAGKVGVATAEGSDVVGAAVNGLATDVRRGTNVALGFTNFGASWAAEGVATTADFAGRAGYVSPSVANATGSVASAGAGLTSLLSSASSAAPTMVAVQTGPGGQTTMMSTAQIYGPTATNSATVTGSVATNAANNATNTTTSSATGFKAVLSDIASVASPAAKIGSIGMTVYSGLTAADLHNEDGEFSARIHSLQASQALKNAEREGQLREMEADLADVNAQMSDEESRLAKLRAQRDEKNAGLEMESVLKKKRQTVGKARVAAAANGVLLEGREESVMSVYEQDAAAEAAVELGKIRENADVKSRVNMANAYIAKANASMGRAKAAMSRFNAAGARYKGAFDAIVATQNAHRARRMGSLQATSDYIGMGASVFSQGASLLGSFV